MKRLAIALGIVSTVVLTSLVTTVLYTVLKSEQPTLPVVAKELPPTVNEVYSLINLERAKVGVAPLTLDIRLNSSAQRKTDEMITENNYGHVNRAGVHGYSYIPAGELKCKTVSENITGATSSQDAVKKWMESEAHRLALQNPVYDSTGLGVGESKGGYAGYTVVQHFCDT